MTDDISTDWPILTLPAAEAAVLREAYGRAKVILEYGSGGSTVYAAHQPGKLIFSVESDRDWAINLQYKIDVADLPSLAIVYHVDIGPTGAWGRPINESSWRQFHNYPTAVWSERFFRPPDVILIDGRFRPACFVAACLRATQPTTVLFDDYVERPDYHVIERLVKPSRIVGRMAEFQVVPQSWPYWAHDLLLELCTAASFSHQKNLSYGLVKE